MSAGLTNAATAADHRHQDVAQRRQAVDHCLHFADRAQQRKDNYGLPFELAYKVGEAGRYLRPLAAGLTAFCRVLDHIEAVTSDTAVLMPRRLMVRPVSLDQVVRRITHTQPQQLRALALIPKLAAIRASYARFLVGPKQVEDNQRPDGLYDR